MSLLHEEFVARGVVRLPRAFSVEAAEAIGNTVWGSIERRTEIRRREVSTWPSGAAAGVSFKNLKGRRVFEPVVRSEPVMRALDELLGEGVWQPPKVGAQILITFPSGGPWIMPRAWHIDGGFERPVWPPPAIRMFSFFDAVSPEGGGTLLLEGSHHLVERYMAENPSPIPGNSVTWGRFMRHHTALADLHREHTEEAPRRDLIGTSIDVDGIQVRAIEVTGDPGDMYLAHFYVLHSGAPNVSDRPRQMLSTTASPLRHYAEAMTEDGVGISACGHHAGGRQRVIERAFGDSPLPSGSVHLAPECDGLAIPSAGATNEWRRVPATADPPAGR